MLAFAAAAMFALAASAQEPAAPQEGQPAVQHRQMRRPMFRPCDCGDEACTCPKSIEELHARIQKAREEGKRPEPCACACDKCKSPKGPRVRRQGGADLLPGEPPRAGQAADLLPGEPPRAGQTLLPGEPPRAGHQNDDLLPGEPPRAGQTLLPGEPPRVGHQNDDLLPGEPPRAGHRGQRPQISRADRAKMLRARAAELEKRAAELEAEEAK